MVNESSFWVLYGMHTEPTFVEGTGHMFQQAQRDASLRYVRRWRNALDVGANVGQWTRPLAKKFKQVMCFEPNPNFRDCFNMNIAETNVTLHPYGLSNHEHTVTQGFNATHLNDTLGDTTPRDGDIQCRTLDSFNITDVDYIKIDIDGFEIPMLQGAEKTLRKNNPVINIEMKERKRPTIVIQCRQLLHDYGYACHSRVKSDEVWLKS